MAFSVAVIDKTVFGNKAVRVLSCVADSAAESIDTGLDAIDFIQATHKSMTSGAGKFGFSGGNVVVSGVASGDEFYVTVYGR